MMIRVTTICFFPTSNRVFLKPFFFLLTLQKWNNLAWKGKFVKMVRTVNQLQHVHLFNPLSNCKISPLTRRSTSLFNGAQTLYMFLIGNCLGCGNPSRHVYDNNLEN